MHNVVLDGHDRNVFDQHLYLEFAMRKEEINLKFISILIFNFCYINISSLLLRLV